MSSALKSLALAARRHGIELSAEKLMHDYALKDQEPSERQLLKISRENRLKAKMARLRWEDFANLKEAFPVITQLTNNRWVVIAGHKENTLFVLDPLTATPTIEKIEKERFLALWAGRVLFLKRQVDLLDEDQPFSYWWLAKEFFKQKALVVQVVTIALVLHMFAVLPAVFIMIVLDKVVNYQAYATLHVMVVGIVIAYLFNGLLGYLRNYIVLFFTSKLEVNLTTRIFNRLLDLPLSYFHHHPAASVIKIVQQTGTIRQFLVGHVFATFLDATALLIFIPILLLYSPALFAIVFLFALLMSLNILFSTRHQKEAQKLVGAYGERKQDILMNSIQGIETVKALALEPIQKKQWEEYAAQQILANLELGKRRAISSQIGSTLQQLMTVAVIFVGVMLVFDGSVSPGVLIGFNMLAGRVTGPLLQLVNMVTDFEKFSVAINLIASITNRQRGIGRRHGAAPTIAGGVTFSDVSFHYRENQPILNKLSFTVYPRQKIAIVGPSGSGKSTLIRLIQGLLEPAEGTISIDGQDIRAMDVGHLRLNVSSVTQNETFFSETIRENIIKPMPHADFQRMTWTTRMVGLHEEIVAMPEGYETRLEQSGANLSSGQKQKIAIARALIRNPKILILDEAFSNIGIDNELTLLKNMPEIQQGRTLFIITHRLSQITDADQILVLNKGQLVEVGTHSALAQQNGVYAELLRKEAALKNMAAT